MGLRRSSKRIACILGNALQELKRSRMGRLLYTSKTAVRPQLTVSLVLMVFTARPEVIFLERITQQLRRKTKDGSCFADSYPWKKPERVLMKNYSPKYLSIVAWAVP